MTVARGSNPLPVLPPRDQPTPCPNSGSCQFTCSCRHQPPPPNPIVAQYTMGVGASPLLQMMAKAPWVAAQLLKLVRLRVALDTVWGITRVVVLCLAVTYSPDRVVEVWAWGYTLASLLYVLGHYLAFSIILKHPAPGLPLARLGDLQLEHGQWRVASTFLGKGLVKQLLTEGEKHVMTVFSLPSLSELSIYDLVVNLDSLAPRFFFQPVEKSNYLSISQLWQLGVALGEQQQEEQCRQGHHRLLRIMLSLDISFLGFSYSHFLLSLYGHGKN